MKYIFLEKLKNYNGIYSSRQNRKYANIIKKNISLDKKNYNEIYPPYRQNKNYSNIIKKIFFVLVQFR
uniref:Uncharacterized protein n=1 Tax=viral metagenome TaxID=1070528 RepID=A0A6C0AF08_9ZZZZ